MVILIFSVVLLDQGKTKEKVLAQDTQFLSGQVKDFNLSEKVFQSYLTSLNYGGDILEDLAEEKKKLASLEYINYTVSKGDTLLKIARKFNVLVDDLIAYNDLNKNGLIKIGQKIKIPGISGLKNIRRGIYSGQYVKAQTYLAGIYVPVSGFNWGELHGNNATDIAAPCGSPIYAAKEGVVILSQDGWNGGYGNTIRIQSKDGTVTVYGHLLKRFVSVGDYVDANTLIGLVGNTGLVYGKTGCHLHFEVRGGLNPLI